VHLHILLVPYRSWQESEVQLVQSFHQLNHRYSQNTCLLPEKRLAANFIINITYAYREDYEISRYLKKTSGHHLRNLRLQKRLNILYPSQHFWLKKNNKHDVQFGMNYKIFTSVCSASRIFSFSKSC